MQPALYRAERPEVFEDIIGQKHIVRILQNQIRTGTVSQAYLFAGTHGTGKTSTARILAKAVNCTGFDEASAASAADAPGNSHMSDTPGTPPCGRCDNCEAIREGRFVDCIELDAASNNGVDDLRAIIEMVKYPPAVGRYKVYIIDEVHMLSTAAENAFLKTLEEPPAHAIFILATTDPQKVRSTIRSRCMQLNFKRVTEEELVAGMDRICKKRGIAATDDALSTIASRADGSVRDALSILEQCMAAGDRELSRAAVLEYTGAAGEDFYLALTGAVISGDAGRALIYIDEILKRGKDARQILKDWLKHYRDLMIVKYVGKAERIVGASGENITRLRAQAAGLDAAGLEAAIRLISEYINLGRYSERPRILLETAAVRLASQAKGGPTQAAALKAASPHPGARSANQGVQSAFASELSPGALPASASDQSVRASAAAAPAFEAAEAPYGMAAAEISGNPEEMWDRIVREISAGDNSFMSFIGRNSRGSNYDAGELTVIVRPGKLRLAEDRSGEIARTAKGLFGSEVYVSLRAGDPSVTRSDTYRTADSEEETARIINEDISKNEIIEDVESLFGITPVIEE